MLALYKIMQSQGLMFWNLLNVWIFFIVWFNQLIYSVSVKIMDYTGHSSEIPDSIFI